MSEAAPIELAPKRLSRVSGARRGVRVGGRWAHLVLALAVVAGVFVQVYLIGAYIFGAGQGALDAHKTAGWTVHGFEMLVFVAALVAWLPWVDLVLSLLLAVIGTVQVFSRASTAGSAESIRCSRSLLLAWQRRSSCGHADDAATHADRSTRPLPTRLGKRLASTALDSAGVDSARSRIRAGSSGCPIPVGSEQHRFEQFCHARSRGFESPSLPFFKAAAQAVVRA